MYETRRQALLPQTHFLRRMFLHGLFAIGLLTGSLAMGMCGYAYFEQLPWQDGFLNSAMLLGGMGPVNAPHTAGGKLFAGLYALYAGLVFIIAVGVSLAPMVHRAMHRFHWEQKG